MIEMIGETILNDLKDERSDKSYVHVMMFIPVTSIKMALSGNMPLVWTGDGAHMNSMGTFLSFVFRDLNHNIQCACYGVFFDTECYDTWKEMFEFCIEVFGKEHILNSQMRIVADQDKGFDKSFDEFLPDVNRFSCSNHLSENIQKRFTKETKSLFLSAVKAPTKESCENFIKQFSKDVIEEKDKNQMFLSYLGDNTCGLTIHTNNNAESINSKHKLGRQINVVNSLKAIIERDAISHQQHHDELDKQIQNSNGDLNIITKGLKNTHWFKERIDMGRNLCDNQRVHKIDKESFNVLGLQKNYTVHLSKMICDYGAFMCRHILAAAIFDGRNVETLFGDAYSLATYKDQIESSGNYPTFPSSAAVDKHFEKRDNNLCIPVGGKRAKGAPKKNIRKKGARERSIMENKKRKSAM